jgi:hypothetical protein
MCRASGCKLLQVAPASQVVGLFARIAGTNAITWTVPAGSAIRMGAARRRPCRATPACAATKSTYEWARAIQGRRRPISEGASNSSSRSGICQSAQTALSMRSRSDRAEIGPSTCALLAKNSQPSCIFHPQGGECVSREAKSSFGGTLSAPSSVDSDLTNHFHGHHLHRGGNVFDEFTGAGISVITTQTVGSSEAIGYVEKTHVRVSNVRQYCQWKWVGTWTDTVHMICCTVRLL